MLYERWTVPTALLGRGKDILQEQCTAPHLFQSSASPLCAPLLQPKYGFWRPNAEIINGRAAMVGLVALLITEW